MHWSTCCSKACVSTPDVRGHSWPPSAVGKVYREFALDHGTCHAFLYACTLGKKDNPTESRPTIGLSAASYSWSLQAVTDGFLYTWNDFWRCVLVIKWQYSLGSYVVHRVLVIRLVHLLGPVIEGYSTPKKERNKVLTEFLIKKPWRTQRTSCTCVCVFTCVSSENR